MIKTIARPKQSIPRGFSNTYRMGHQLNDGHKNRFCPVCFFEGKIRIADGRHGDLCLMDCDYYEERWQ